MSERGSFYFYGGQSRKAFLFADLNRKLNTSGLVYVTDDTVRPQLDIFHPVDQRLIIYYEADCLSTFDSISNPDTLLSRKVSEYGLPSLDEIVWSDRRLSHHRYYPYRNLTRNKVGQLQRLHILQTILVIETLIERHDPTCLVSFQSTTLFDYLGYFIFKSRALEVINLRPSRIENYILRNDSIFEPTIFPAQTEPKADIKFPSGKIDKIIQNIKARERLYEGAVLQSAGSEYIPRSTGRVGASKVLSLLFGSIAELRRYYRSPKVLRTCFIFRIERLILEYLIRRLSRWLESRARLFVIDEYPTGGYIYFPLHCEPEVSLGVYGFRHRDQIEVVRNLLQRLPSNMRLVVKEHPWNVGKREINKWRLLAQSEKLLTVDARLNSDHLIANSDAVFTISGSAGITAIAMGKPVILAGQAIYGDAPSDMVLKIKNLEEEPLEVISVFMKRFKYDPAYLTQLVASVLKFGRPVDFYSVLLGRLELGRNYSEDIYEENLRVLSELISSSYK